MDPRVWELAKILVDYSVSVQDGDVVMISADLDGSQLMDAVYRRVLQRGGYPRFKVSMPEVTRILYEEAYKSSWPLCSRSTSRNMRHRIA